MAESSSRRLQVEQSLRADLDTSAFTNSKATTTTTATEPPKVNPASSQVACPPESKHSCDLCPVGAWRARCMSILVASALRQKHCLAMPLSRDLETAGHLHIRKYPLCASRAWAIRQSITGWYQLLCMPTASYLELPQPLMAPSSTQGNLRCVAPAPRTL